MGEHYQGIALLNVELVKRQLVHEGLYQVVCGKVEDQTEKNGNGQSRKRFLEDGKKQQGQTQALRGQRKSKQNSQENSTLRDCVPNKIRGTGYVPVTDSRGLREVG